VRQENDTKHPAPIVRASIEYTPTPSRSMRFGSVALPLGLLPPQVRVTPAALDPVQQRRSWEVSETLTAVGQ
jgi:hypothetical protein